MTDRTQIYHSLIILKNWLRSLLTSVNDFETTCGFAGYSLSIPCYNISGSEWHNYATEWHNSNIFFFQFPGEGQIKYDCDRWDTKNMRGRLHWKFTKFAKMYLNLLCKVKLIAAHHDFRTSIYSTLISRHTCMHLVESTLLCNLGDILHVWLAQPQICAVEANCDRRVENKVRYWWLSPW